MAKLDINETEKAIIQDGLDKALQSAKRMQNSNKQPQIVEVYKTTERNILAVQIKVADAK
jgi:hypothetical protein